MRCARRRPARTPFVALREFCEFWADQRHSIACCQLDQANREAWALFGRLDSRFARDYQLTADLFRGLVAGWPAEDIVEALERLTVMYDVLVPPQQAD
jgi:hypothetical protein